MLGNYLHTASNGDMTIWGDLTYDTWWWLYYRTGFPPPDFVAPRNHEELMLYAISPCHTTSPTSAYRRSYQPGLTFTRVPTLDFNTSLTSTYIQRSPPSLNLTPPNRPHFHSSAQIEHCDRSKATLKLRRVTTGPVTVSEPVSWIQNLQRSHYQSLTISLSRPRRSQLRQLPPISLSTTLLLCTTIQ